MTGKKNGKNTKQQKTKQPATEKPMSQWREQRGNKKIPWQINESENTTVQNLWNAAKVVLRGKFIVIQAYLKKQEKSQINNLTFHLKG